MKNVFGIILISLLVSGAIAGLVLLTRSSNSERYSVSNNVPSTNVPSTTTIDPGSTGDDTAEIEIDTIHYVQF